MGNENQPLGFMPELDDDFFTNRVVERPLRDRSRNSGTSSDSEDDVPDASWDAIIANYIKERREARIYVPCLYQKAPPYPKLSAINSKEQFRCLKVLCYENPHILPGKSIPPPSNKDRKFFEALKTRYENEQKEFIAWAKELWTNNHCVRALHPKPEVEKVYEAIFKMRAFEMRSFPKTYERVALLSLEKKNSNAFEMILDKEIITVDIQSLPQLERRLIRKKTCIIKTYSLPEPCTKHPCRFILPYLNSVSTLLLTDIHEYLADFGYENKAQYVVSEDALQCLLEWNRPWEIPVTVHRIFELDDDTKHVVVLGNEFAARKEPVLSRTYKAFKLLLLPCLIPSISELSDDESSDDEGNDVDVDDSGLEFSKKDDEAEKSTEAGKDSKSLHKEAEDHSGVPYGCTCKDTLFEKPPQRSFSKWQVKDNTTGVNYDVIVHCPHQVRDKNGEVLFEPIPEYQLELGGSAQPPGIIRSLGLWLHLRNNASLLNVRINGVSGEVATLEAVDAERFRREHGDVMSGVAQILHTAFSQLQGKLPGTYILRHAANGSTDVMLFAAKPTNEGSMLLDIKPLLGEINESKSVSAAPEIVPVLLPFHNGRRR
ncbi:uncharacterized protein LOC120635958 isoform X2 [Pararge aegeria]|uniref:uncharacterized protein LOC120635958 isoform X2 n=1 Tax=Pararge aegeria TaxID=116150 RepID=UPI0019D08166|nr:uncharacterized protein LOC120635958 isoform X2 [Pararge aegeria]